MPDELIRFLFDTTDVRGEWVQLEHTYRDALANHHYPAGVHRLLALQLAFDMGEIEEEEFEEQEEELLLAIQALEDERASQAEEFEDLEE